MISYKKLATRLFSRFVRNRIDSLRGFKHKYEKSGISMLFETYVSQCILSVVLSFLISFLVSFFGFWFFGFSNHYLYGLMVGFLVSFGVGLFFYSFPFAKARARKESIELNLPYALVFMKEVARSGVKPDDIIQFISKDDGLGELQEEAHKIKNLTKIHGYDTPAALDKVAKDTPSDTFKEFLHSFSSTLRLGSGIEYFLDIESREKMLEFRMRLKDYANKLSLYSTMYTSLAIAAPLLFIVTGVLINAFGGTRSSVQLLTFAVLIILPLINIGYLLFLHFSQPKI